MSMLKLKQFILMLLRKTGLIGVADRVLLLWHIAKNRRDNEAYRREFPQVPLPSYEILFDVSAGCHYRSYYATGAVDAGFLVETMKRFLPGDAITVCDWGCGPGRLVQHLKKLDPRIVRAIGCDYNPKTVSWCREAFPEVEFLKNDLTPPLPLPDNSLDALYCVSVFTHLSEEMHYRWIEEILRVLKPGGIFLGTFHGEKTRQNLLPWEAADFDSGKLVVRKGAEEGTKNYGANHCDAFVRKLLSGFESVTLVEWPSFHQELYCGRKPVPAPQAASGGTGR